MFLVLNCPVEETLLRTRSWYSSTLSSKILVLFWLLSLHPTGINICIQLGGQTLFFLIYIIIILVVLLQSSSFNQWSSLRALSFCVLTIVLNYSVYSHSMPCFFHYYWFMINLCDKFTFLVPFQDSSYLFLGLCSSTSILDSTCKFQKKKKIYCVLVWIELNV